MEVERGGIELVRSTSFGRKRVALFRACVYFRDDDEEEDCVFLSRNLKRHCSLSSFLFAERSPSPLEDLPQDILVRILCGVEHDDLKRLLFVSKALKEATLIARQSHFAFRTPTKTLKFPNAEDLSLDSNDIDESPCAPKKPRARLSPNELSSIAVALFAFDDGDSCAMETGED